MPFNGGGKDITDARYVRVKIQHSFIAMPQNVFKPRKDDPRVGFFSARKWTTLPPYLPQNLIKDKYNRWNLVKKDPTANP
jgi:hypothetical protein